MSNVGNYRVRVVNRQLMQDGIRYAALLDREAREILVSSMVPVTDQLQACARIGARIEAGRHPGSIPVVQVQTTDVLRRPAHEA